jgi:biopolymer transport protein ExbD
LTIEKINHIIIKIEMITRKKTNMVVNILTHISILMIVLSIFFFMYGKKIVQENIEHELKSNVEKQTRTFLNDIDELHKNNKLLDYKIDWDKVRNTAIGIENSVNVKSASKIKSNNNKVRDITIFVCILLVSLVIFTIFYAKIYRGTKTNLRSIFIENSIMFLVIVGIEFYFFTNIVMKYVPVDPTFIENSILERIQHNLNYFIAE